MASPRVQLEANRLRNQPETYTKPLTIGSFDIALVTDFMSEFNKDLDKYEADFKMQLEEYPTTLGIQYKALVPREVPHKSFLQRYFYRCCDLQRIQNEMEKVSNETETDASNIHNFAHSRHSAPVITTDTSSSNGVHRNSSARSAGGGVRFRGIANPDPSNRAAWASEEVASDEKAAAAPPKSVQRQATLIEWVDLESMFSSTELKPEKETTGLKSALRTREYRAKPSDQPKARWVDKSKIIPSRNGPSIPTRQLSLSSNSDKILIPEKRLSLLDSDDEEEMRPLPPQKTRSLPVNRRSGSTVKLIDQLEAPSKEAGSKEADGNIEREEPQSLPNKITPQRRGSAKLLIDKLESSKNDSGGEGAIVTTGESRTLPTEVRQLERKGSVRMMSERLEISTIEKTQQESSVESRQSIPSLAPRRSRSTARRDLDQLVGKLGGKGHRESADARDSLRRLNSQKNEGSNEHDQPVTKGPQTIRRQLSSRRLSSRKWTENTDESKTCRVSNDFNQTPQAGAGAGANGSKTIEEETSERNHHPWELKKLRTSKNSGVGGGRSSVGSRSPRKSRSPVRPSRQIKSPVRQRSPVQSKSPIRIRPPFELKTDDGDLNYELKSPRVRHSTGEVGVNDRVKNWGSNPCKSYDPANYHSQSPVRNKEKGGLAHPLATKSVVRANRRRNAIETYTEVLDLDAQATSEDAQEFHRFIGEFNYTKLEDGIQITLAMYPDSVGRHFQTLVPAKVAPEEFWRRYFYRCDEKRILNELRRRDALGTLGQSMAFSADPSMFLDSDSNLLKGISEGFEPASGVEKSNISTASSIKDRLKNWNQLTPGGNVDHSIESKQTDTKPQQAQSLSDQQSLQDRMDAYSSRVQQKESAIPDKLPSVDSPTVRHNNRASVKDYTVQLDEKKKAGIPKLP